MALRKAMGAVKDQTSIGIAKVASNMAPELEVAIVKATSHDDDPASEKYIREILQLTSYSRGYVSTCVHAVSKRLSKTRDWIVALKCLVLIHRLLNDGDVVFQQEIMYATRKGTRLLNMSDFRDEAHSNSWDHSTFVRTYGFYLDQKLDLIAYERKQNSGGGEEPDRFREDRWRSPPSRGNDYGYNDDPGYGGNMRRSRSFGDVKEGSSQAKNNVTPLRDMPPERIFGKMGHLQRLLDRILSCRPTGLARNSRLVLVALYPVVQESFKLYADICEVLAILLDRFFDMEYQDCVKAFDAYVSAGKQIDELVGFYNWCKDMGIARSSDYPEVQKITAKLLETLEEFVRDRAKAMSSPEKKPEVVEQVKEEEPEYDMNEIKALPAPETPPPPPPPPAPEPPKAEPQQPLVDLREDGTLTADDQGNRFALALFAGPAANKTNGNWEAFGSNGESEVTSAWQNPAAEAGKADWELPAPDGSVQTVGGDPFAASLSVPPPSYVQMADMEKKQQLLVQEQMVWQQYARSGMQGQSSLTTINNGGYIAPGQPPMMPYGYPPVNGAGYYHPNPY
ncbi:putative ANTH domain, ENTH domain, ANTH domain superfamily protein [Helianthus annuus]|nr:putative ANTH domain, ENTH domain, ANTH domain superfamily protein [Helianthus annuus]KAJ0460260.1 putative ANTH domain, ENTH domain, ANTH domain superfamily protein [Helianthus annuus]KAJ0640698.1 putative ANTH domain, ENTH domain, ANTH domain superfamily protein [Helianthus annuus]